MSRATLFQLLLALVLCTGSAPLFAQERILSHDSEVLIHPDGSMDVTEHIRVRAEGQNIRRGLTRDFPTGYIDGNGNRVRVGFEVYTVLRDGEPEPWFTETLFNGIRLNTGDDNFLPVPGEFTYTFRYHTTRQLGFFQEHDELYWSAIGTGSIFPIETATVEVQLPYEVDPEAMRITAYTGTWGSRDQNWEGAITAPGVARWQLTAPLKPREAFTIVLGFPKGVVEAPGPLRRFWWLLTDNRAGLIALLGLLTVLGYGLPRWHRIGRDAKPGPVVVQYNPPDGLPPSMLRLIERRHPDMRGVSADVLALAVAGKLRIKVEKKGRRAETWRLERTDDSEAGDTADDALAPGLEPLARALFRKEPHLTLDDSGASRARTIFFAHQQRIRRMLKRLYGGRLYQSNSSSVLIVLGIAVAFSVAALAIGHGTGGGQLLALPLVGLTIVAAIVLALLLPAVTPEGRVLRDRIEGFRRYLSVADREELKRLQPPGTQDPILDEQRYQFLLPYAVALKVEDAWTRKFTLAVGASAAAAATSTMAWYSSNGRPVSDMGAFSRAVGRSLTTRIDHVATPPGSGSGFSGGSSGGGGFSGGGGGGGGIGGR